MTTGGPAVAGGATNDPIGALRTMRPKRILDEHPGADILPREPAAGGSLDASKPSGSIERNAVHIAGSTTPNGSFSTGTARSLNGNRSSAAAELARLEAERARLESLVHSSRDVIAVIDATGRCSYVSPAVEEVSGFTPDEVTGANGFDFVHPDDFDDIALGLQEVVANPGSSVTVETRARTKTGGWIWIEIRAVNRLDDPAVGGIVLNYHDITERRRAADSISKSERALARAQAVAKIGSFTADLRTNAYFWSDELYRLLGYEVGSITPSYEAVLAAIHPDDRERYHSERQASLTQGGAFEATFRVVHPDASVHWLEVRSASVLEDGVAVGRVGTVQDVTLRNEMEQQLLEREQLFRGAFDAAQTGIALIAADGLTYVDVNVAFCEMLGYSEEELLELDWRQITHPDDLDDNDVAFEKLLQGNREVQYLTKRFICKNGDTIVVDMCDSVVYTPDRSAIYFLMHATDVTERHKAAADKTILEARVVQAEKMQAVGQLAGGVAHDFNNILSVILNYAEFAREDMELEDPRRSDIDEVINAGNKAAHLVRQLLAFSRKEVIQPRVMELNNILSDLDELLSRLLGENIELYFDTDPQLPHVKLDRSQLEQIIVNLAVNARDAISQGGVLLIDTATETVAADSRPGLPPGVYVRLCVSDTGQGMDEATKERVFEPFFTTKPRGEGTGLGLATVYGNVKQMGGCVYIDSEVGVGTTFSIYLPAHHEEVDPVDETQEPGDLAGTEHVLLVEDDDAVRAVAIRILTKHGYEVTAFSNGPDALEFFRDNIGRVDLLVTDVVMPQMSGKTLADEATSLGAHLQTLFMSGYTDALIAQQGVLDAGEHLITKPFTEESLLVRVRSLLGRRGTR